MEHVLLICFVNKYVDVLPERNLEGGSQESWGFEEIELMRGSGHKDKNGKFIYEGDLLKFFDKVIAEVTFEPFGGWCYKWIDETYIRFRSKNPEPFFHNINMWEVVGNIYQNPELL